MPKFPNHFTAKLQRLEQEKSDLIQQRRHELVALIEKVGYLGLDDEMLVGSLLFIKECSEQEASALTPDVKSALELIKAKGIHFFRRKPKTTKPSKKRDTQTA